MALVLADRVLETTSVAGTGDAALNGAQDNYQPFSVIGNGSTTYYTIVDDTNNEWEVGIGTYISAGNKLQRDTVLSSSNGGALVYFASGTKDIFLDLPSEEVLLSAGDVTGPASAVANNFAAFNLTTGKLIKDSGYNSSSFATAAQGAKADTAVQPGSLGSAAYLTAGAANGVATLDSSGKVPTSQIPQMGDLNYQGTWDASTNTPTLVSSSGTKGYYYVVSVAGNTNLNGITNWNIGDWAVYNGSVWQKIDNTDSVTSVNGYTGTVVLTASDVGAQPAGTYVTSVGATSPVTSTGGTTPTIAMPAATTSVSGYLTSTDWNTFNNKLSSQVYPSTGIPNSTGTAWGTSYGVTGSGSVVLNTRPTMSVTGAGLTLQDATDNTKQANFDLNGITTATTRTYTLPNVTGSLVTLGNIAQSFTGATTFSSTLAASSTINLIGAGGNGANFHTSATSGATAIGGGAQTGSMTVGQSTASQTTNIQAGATASGSVKTLNIGTGGLAGSTTTMAIGSTFGTTVAANGTWTFSTPLVATNMVQATTSTSGYLTSTDWNTFNSKGSGTVTSVSGTGTVSGISLSGTVTSTGSLTLGGTLDLSSPPTIGNTTANTITGTTITASTAYKGTYYDANSSAGGSLRTSGGTACFQWGAGGGNNCTVDGSINMNGSNAHIDMSPTGTGHVSINPTGVGDINNVIIGATTPLAGKFTSLTATGTTTLATSLTGLAKLTSGVVSTATSGTDYAPATSGTSILYGNGSGGFSNVTIGTGVSFAGGTLSATGSGGTVTSVTGTAPVVSSGGTTPAISMAAANTTTDGYLTSTDWNTFNSKQPAGSYLTTVTADAPLSGSGTSGSHLVISQANTTTNGYLSSTDWNTFNSKQPAGTYVTTITVVSANGFTGSSSGGATPALTLGTSITGLLKGNGTAISAATSGTDYAPATSGTSILYGNGAGGFSNVIVGSGLSFSAGTLSAPASGVTSLAGTANQITASASTGAVTLSTPSTFIAPGSIAATTSVTGTVLNATNGIVVNSQTISASYSIPSGSSGMSAGPITVSSGVVVTVPSGSKWVVL